MTHWAYCEDIGSDSAVVTDSEAHHLLHVLRVETGYELTVFDGNGIEAAVIVTATTRRDVSCRIVSRKRHERRSGSRLTMIVAPPKADRLKWMVEKLTEVGVDQLVLLQAQRTIVTPSETRIDKLKGNVVAACKQSRRPFLMELLPLQKFESVLEERQTQSDEHATFIAHPSDQTVDPSGLLKVGQSVSVLVGPEGGFTDDEVQRGLSAGATPVSWPNGILRIETAAIVFASLLMPHTC